MKVDIKYSPPPSWGAKAGFREASLPAAEAGELYKASAPWGRGRGGEAARITVSPALSHQGRGRAQP